jgi:hypothetical protein
MQTKIIKWHNVLYCGLALTSDALLDARIVGKSMPEPIARLHKDALSLG